MIKAAKDAALSKLSKALVNTFGIAKYGTITSLRLDSTSKTIRISLTLKGESNPIDLEAHYRLETQPESKFLIIETAQCSREWATLVFNDFCPPEARRIRLPRFVDILL